MVIKHCCKLMAGALVLSLTAGTFAATTTGVDEQIKALRAEVAQLRADSDANWLNERRVEQVKDIVREVLSDADTRASLMESGMTAGHNGHHFFLASEDGSFLMKIAGQVQFRYIMNQRQTPDPLSTTDGGEFGFQLRRTKLKFKGHVGSPKIGYAIGLQVSRNSQVVELDHAVLKYHINDDLVLWGGVTKGPFLREELTSSSRQLAVERSLMNEIFTIGRVQGIGLIWDASDQVIAQVSINDGQNSGEPGGAKVPGGVKTGNDFAKNITDFAITGRVDFRVLGNWKQKKEFTTWSGKDNSLFIGAAAHYEVGETGDQQVATKTSTGPAPALTNLGVDSIFSWTVDASATCEQGATLYAAVAGTHREANDPGTSVGLYGVLVQGSYHVIADKLEPFVRYELISSDAFKAQDVNIVTFGANWYLRKHASKFTLDVVWALDPLTKGNLGQSKPSSGLGLETDNANQDGQVALRAQFQLLF